MENTSQILRQRYVDARDAVADIEKEKAAQRAFMLTLPPLEKVAWLDTYEILVRQHYHAVRAARHASEAIDAHEYRREVDSYLARWGEAPADPDELSNAMAAFAREEDAKDAAERIMLDRH